MAGKFGAGSVFNSGRKKTWQVGRGWTMEIQLCCMLTLGCRSATTSSTQCLDLSHCRVYSLSFQSVNDQSVISICHFNLYLSQKKLYLVMSFNVNFSCHSMWCPLQSFSVSFNRKPMSYYSIDNRYSSAVNKHCIENCDVKKQPFWTICSLETWCSSHGWAFPGWLATVVCGGAEGDSSNMCLLLCWNSGQMLLVAWVCLWLDVVGIV